MSFYMNEAQINLSIESNLKCIEDELATIAQIEKQVIADRKLKKPTNNADDVKYFDDMIKRSQENILMGERVIKARHKQLEKGLSVEEAFKQVDQESDGQLGLFD
ncbi:hypothetical protein EHS13_20035 [Paenibacillus psychroresistens]|uniref:Uncharacterized protein n=1 Tax=Paenibacillus psychroresistens TaxID=1778678 RepID=A0A6B8RL27_9BACL|nr:hypothetical protein [Paenibacillus psychroresistens]QGQ97010.1 hypothetical protein EHS13_20035 [Paenibacillus psychroresistens]